MKITVNGQQIDTFDDATKVKISVLDIKQPLSRKAYKTEQIKIPASARNIRIIGNFTDITSVLDTSQTATYSDGVVQFTGKLYVYEAVLNRSNGYYNIQIVSGNGDWSTAFSGKNLTDYDFSSLNHDYTKTNITNSWSVLNDYVYPVVDYGKFHGVAPVGKLTNENVGVHDLLPAVNIKHLIEKIFNNEGFSVDDNTDEELDNYYLLAKNPNIYTQEDANNAKFNASIGSGITGYGYKFEQSVPAGSTVQMDLEQDGEDLNGYDVLWSSTSAFDNNYDNGSNLNTSTGVYTVPVTGSYEFACKLRLYLQIPPNDFTIVGDDVVITAAIRVNGVTVTSNTFTRSATAQGELIVKDKMRELTAGDEVTVRILTNTPDLTNTNPAKAKTISLSIEQGLYTYFECDTLTRPALNHSWTYDQFIPDIPVVDFLKGIFHLFNIVVITEPALRNVRYYNYKNFYLSSVLFTPKIDESKDVQIAFPDTPFTSSVGYKIDGNDNRITNKRVLFTMNNGDGEESALNTVFANTYIANSDQLGATVPILHNNSTIIQTSPYILPSQTFEWLPRILHYTGNTAHSWTLDRSAQTEIPVFDVTGIDVEDLKENYRKMQYQRNNGRLLSCSTDIDSSVVAGIINNNTGGGIRGLVEIDNVRYIFNTISYTEKESTKVELLRWHPVSTGVTAETVTVTDEQTSSGGGTTGSAGSGTGTTQQTGLLLTDGDGEQYTIEFENGTFGINYCINQSTGLNEIYIIHSISTTQAVISTLAACEISWRA